jgi:hypothetical protein
MPTFKVLKDFSQYEISDSGIIRKIVSKEIVKQRKHPREGLMMCDLYDNNLISRTVYPHKEVAKTFVKTKKKGRLLVIHTNGKRHDNRIKNLQWISIGDYQKLQVERGTRDTIGNPELYKHSKFWLAKHKKEAKAKKIVKATLKPLKKVNKTAKSAVDVKKAVVGKPAKVKSTIKPTKSLKVSKTLKTKQITFKAKLEKPLIKKEKATKTVKTVQSSKTSKTSKTNNKKSIAIKTKAPAIKKEKIAKNETPAFKKMEVSSEPAKSLSLSIVKPKRKRIKGKKVFSVKS